MNVTKLTLTARHIDRLRDRLLQPDGLERITFLYCSTSGDRLLAEELVPVADGEYGTLQRTGCRPDLQVERDRLHTCVDRGMQPVIVHSHPFHEETEVPQFSPRDDRLMDGLQQMVAGLYPETLIGFAVLGQQGINTRLYDPTADRWKTLPITVTGGWTLDTPLTKPVTNAADEIDINRLRTDRTVRAITEAGQRQLAATQICLVGLGGLGSLMAEEFARYGVGDLTLIDPDVVEESNLPRLFGAYTDDVGRPKVDVVEEHLSWCNPVITTRAIQDPVEETAARLKDCDLLVAGVDQVSARMWLNQFAVRHCIPYVDAGVVIDTDDEDTIEAMEGYIQVIAPGATACFDCLDRADPEQARIERLSEDELAEELERGYIDESDLSPEPAVVPLNGVVASKTVQEVAKLVTGYAAPAGFLRFDSLANEFEAATILPRDSCVICGADGVLGRGDRTAPAVTKHSDGLDLAIDPFTTGDETDPESEST